MKGRIISISGPTVTVEMPGLKLYDRMLIGKISLQGEVVRLTGNKGIVQVYEDTRGLAVNEPAECLGNPLSVSLGPGLLTGTCDGLQRPLTLLSQSLGPFIKPGTMLPPLDLEAEWAFDPVKKTGDQVSAGDLLGTITEGVVNHKIFAPHDGTIKEIASGKTRLNKPVCILDDDTPIFAYQEWPIRQPRTYAKKLSPSRPLITGQRIIDFLFPMAQGGTAILPGGFGTGKTILEQAIAKFADVDVVVYVGCGERGNEMADMLKEFGELNDPWTGNLLMDRTVLVANTSNMPVAAREASIYTAVTMAEYYRDMGCHVLLLADSISRWAEALREISSALEEMPGEEGYPTYLASRLAGFFSRSGVVETHDGKTGSLSMILSVSPPGGDFTEPVTQACLRNSGAFLMLDTSLANRRHFPAINWFQSFSLYESDMGQYFTENINPDWPELRKQCLSLLQQEEKIREVASIVGAEGLQDSDHLLLVIAERIKNEFLSQNSFTNDAFSTPESTSEKMCKLITWSRKAKAKLESGERIEDIIHGVTL